MKKTVLIITMILLNLALISGSQTTSGMIAQEIDYQFIQATNEIFAAEDQNPVIAGDFNYFFATEDDYLRGLELPHLAVYPYLNAIKYDYMQISDVRQIPGSPHNLIGAVKLDELDMIDLDADTGQLYRLGAYGLDGYDGTGVRVGVIDTGADFTHDLLNHLHYVQKSFKGVYLDLTDDHGSAVIGCISGKSASYDYGIATNATIYSAEMGEPNPGYIDGDWLGAFEWLMESNVSIINTSFSGPVESWEPIVKAAYDKGILIVGSAGNEGTNYEANDPFTVSGPGGSPYALSVGGITREEEYFGLNSEGPTHDYVMKPDLTAQAVYVQSVDLSGGIKSWMGTSFSSPLTVGGIAAIWESMLDNSMDPDPSSLKSIVMRHARDPIGNVTDMYSMGYGVSNFTSSWSDLKVNGSEGLVVTPKSIPYDYQIYHARGATQQLNAWIYTGSDPSDIVISYTGNISSLLFQYEPVFNKSQKIPVQIISSPTLDYGRYNGEIIVSNSINTFTVGIEILVQSDYRGTILFDLKYTCFDEGFGYNYANRLSGTSTGEIIQDMWRNGFIFIENNEILTPEILENVDILWLDDFYPEIIYNLDDIYGIPFRMTKADLKIIGDFVRGGGNVLIDFLGKIVKSDGAQLTDYASYIYTNTLLEQFNIELRDTAINEILYDSNEPWEIGSSNSTHILKGITDLTHKGNYIHPIDPYNYSTYILTQTTDGGEVLDWRNGIMAYDHPGGGRLVAASTHTLRELGGSDNDDLIYAIVEWFAESDRLRLNNVVTYNQTTTIDVYYNGTDDIGISVKQGIINYHTTAFTNATVNHYYYNITTPYDVKLDVEITAGDKYVRNQIALDQNPPEMVAETEDGSTVELPHTFKFTVTDPFLSDEIRIWYESKETENYSYEDGIFLTTITDNYTVGLSGHNFRFYVYDTRDHYAIYEFSYIFVDEKPNTTPSTSTTTADEIETITSDTPTTNSGLIFNDRIISPVLIWLTSGTLTIFVLYKLKEPIVSKIKR